MNIVLDTNCLIIAISRQSEYHQVWQDFLAGKYTLCITNEIIEEYSEVLSRNISPLVSELFISAILNRKNVKRISPSFSFHLIEADVDDNKFVDCAFTAGASCIVSNDAHFKILNEVEFPRIFVLNIKDFVELLLRNQGNNHLN